jgi:hypothetical protein
MNRLILAAVAGAVFVGALIGAYEWGAMQSEDRILHRVTVRCSERVRFDWQDPNLSKPTHLECTPEWPVEIHGTSGGTIEL